MHQSPKYESVSVEDGYVAIFLKKVRNIQITQPDRPIVKYHTYIVPAYTIDRLIYNSRDQLFRAIIPNTYQLVPFRLSTGSTELLVFDSAFFSHLFHGKTFLYLWKSLVSQYSYYADNIIQQLLHCFCQTALFIVYRWYEYSLQNTQQKSQTVSMTIDVEHFLYLWEKYGLDKLHRKLSETTVDIPHTICLQELYKNFGRMYPSIHSFTEETTYHITNYIIQNLDLGPLATVRLLDIIH